MVQSQTQPVRRIAFPILIALSVSHCLNDLLQSVISAVYPLFKEDLSLSFAQIGLITLVYQMSASVFRIFCQNSACGARWETVFIV